MQNTISGLAEVLSALRSVDAAADNYDILLEILTKRLANEGTNPRRIRKFFDRLLKSARQHYREIGQQKCDLVWARKMAPDSLKLSKVRVIL